jgi:hypothetical protein
MRQWYLPLVLLSVAACSRESHGPRSTVSAPPPPPGAMAAQSAPAAAAAAAVTGVAVAKPDAGAPRVGAVPAAALAAPRSDPRWRDVDPAELARADQGKAKDPALEHFQTEQQRRDAELMAQDAAEAARQARRGDEREDYAQGDERNAQDRAYRGDDERYRGDDRYAGDPRYAERRASRERERAEDYDRYGRDGSGYDPRDPYAGQDDYPPDDGAYEDAPPDEDYDPRYEDPYQR